MDPLGLIVGGVDPMVRPYLACALKNEAFSGYWQWMDSDDDVWNVTFSKCSARGLDSSCWTPPTFFGLNPGEIHLDPQSRTCKDVVEDLVHEVAEAYANKKLGLSTNALLHAEAPVDPVPGEKLASPAHNHAARADNIAGDICCECAGH
jgi:hypothetical protein